MEYFDDILFAVLKKLYINNLSVLLGWAKKADSLQTTFSNCILLNGNYSNFLSDFIEACCQRYNWLEVNIGSGNGLVHHRHQLISWTDGDLVYWYIYVSPGLM